MEFSSFPGAEATLNAEGLRALLSSLLTIDLNDKLGKAAFCYLFVSLSIHYIW